MQKQVILTDEGLRNYEEELEFLKTVKRKEIAEKLSLSEQTVKNQLSLGLKTLKEKLNKIWLLLMLLFIN